MIPEYTLHNRDASSGEDEVCSVSGGEWLADVSLEDLQDHSVDSMGGDGGDGDAGDGDAGDGGDYRGLDDEAILDRVATEMDLNLSDVTASTHHFASDQSTLGLEPSTYKTDLDPSQHLLRVCSGNANSNGEPSNIQSECSLSTPTCDCSGKSSNLSRDHEDLLFDRAYDFYESSIKFT